VNDDQLERLLRSLADTEDEELSCSECFDLIAAYADLEVNRQDPAATFPQLGQHLRQCGVCREEYEVLCDLARLEAAGQSPSGDVQPDGP
jgi:predicted anti-sigma-YlaC factor YlaD